MTAAFSARRAIDGEIDRARRFGLDPVAEAAQRAVGRERRADAGGERVERRVAAGAGLHHGLDLGAVLVVVAERRERHRRLAGIAVAQDQQAGGRDALGQDLAAQDGRGLGLQERVQGLRGWFRGCWAS